MQINQTTIGSLYKGFRTIYMDAYQGGPAKVKAWAMRTSSNKASEFYGWLGAIPGMKKLVGEITIQNLAAHGFTIANDEFEDTIGIKRADIERDSYGLYNPFFAAMGAAAAQHPDELLANAMLGGFTTLCYTGKNFFDNNHEPQKGGTKFSNKGTMKLSAAGYQTARANIKGRLNAKGRPMNLGINLVLVVSPANEAVGRQILIADMVAQVAGAAAAGVTNVNKGTATLEVWPQLAGTPDAWFLMEVGQPIKPFIWQVEKETEFNAAVDPKTTDVMLTQQFLYQAYGRYAVSYGLPELAFGSNGTTDAL